VFFWSRNRKGLGRNDMGVPWYWIIGAIAGGLVIGTVGAALLDQFYLQPLGSKHELRIVCWLLCLSTPLLLIQTILSNQLVLLKRDREMLGSAALSATVGLCLLFHLVRTYGLIGAALSLGLVAFLSSVIGIYLIQRRHE
jgi:O-antigen/teichoic acid export membrane protein